MWLAQPCLLSTGFSHAAWTHLLPGGRSQLSTAHPCRFPTTSLRALGFSAHFGRSDPEPRADPSASLSPGPSKQGHFCCLPPPASKITHRLSPEQELALEQIAEEGRSKGLLNLMVLLLTAHLVVAFISTSTGVREPVLGSQGIVVPSIFLEQIVSSQGWK